MMLEQWQFRVAITALGGPRAASRRLACSDALVHHWLTGRRPISSEMALRLRDLMIALSGMLPGVAHDLKVAAQQAEIRRMQWRARGPRWQPAGGGKPPLTPLERKRAQTAAACRLPGGSRPVSPPPWRRDTVLSRGRSCEGADTTIALGLCGRVHRLAMSPEAQERAEGGDPKPGRDGDRSHAHPIKQ